MLSLFRIAGLSAYVLEELSDLPKESVTEETYQTIYRQSARKVITLAQHPSVARGVLMSSHSLAQRIAAMEEKPLDIFRKKEQQTARSAWQLVSRIAGKTSPFSSFTHVAVSEVEDTDTGKITSLVRINNQLFGQLLELLRYHPPFYKKQNISLNDTLSLEDNQYIFLLNTRNLESIQNMEAHPVMDCMIELFEQNKQWTFQELVSKLLANVETDRDSLEDYLFDLSTYGMLCWELPAAPDALDWWTPLLATLRRIEADELCRELADCLEELSGLLPLLAKGDAKQRASIQQTAYQRVTKFWNTYHHLIPNMNADTMMTTGLKRLADQRLKIKKENLFFEDTRIAIGKDLDRVGVHLLTTQLNTLVQVLPRVDRSQITDLLLNFYHQHFDQPVSLWKFYKRALRYQLPEQLATAGRNVGYEFSNKKIAKKANSCPDEINLMPSDWEGLPKLDSKSKFSTLVLPFQKDEKAYAYVDSVLPPDGRLAGRFLPLFSKKIQEQWRDYHESLSEGALLIKNQDASFFNANVSIPLVPAKLQVPSQIALNETTTISITDLMISPSADGKALEFTHQNRLTKFLNLSTEAVNNRSGLFQFIIHFTPGIPTKAPLLYFINQHYTPATNGILYYPRIRFDDQLILQRRTWYFPVETLPHKKTVTNNTAYWQGLLQWKKNYQLPDQLYYTLHASEVESNTNSSRNTHKPQYFDFYNTLAIDVFHRAIKKVNNYLKIEEMLPELPHLLSTANEPRSIEALFVK